MTHLLPDVIAGHAAFLIKLDDFHECLWILFLLETSDAGFLEELLPLFGHAGEFSSRRVEADVHEMDRIIGD